MQDRIYSTSQTNKPFKFDNKVATVFGDMIRRSVPGYKEVISSIQQFASQFVQSNTNCYDLGCSLGAASLAMSQGNKNADVKIIAIDNSAEMLKHCQSNIEAFKHRTPVELLNDNIENVIIDNASMVVLNYTLQFIDVENREKILSRIYKGLNPGGIIVLSEKIIFEDGQINDLMVECHHQFKRENGYSELEISQKRNALENVLVPETLHSHLNRLKRVGFDKISCYQQQLNFVSIIAIK